MSDSERAHSGVGGPVKISPRGPLGSDRVAFYAYSGGSAYQRSWGADNGGQRPGQHSRVPGKDISKEKKTKKIKKNSRRGEAMSAVALEEKSKSM